MLDKHCSFCPAYSEASLHSGTSCCDHPRSPYCWQLYKGRLEITTDTDGLISCKRRSNHTNDIALHGAGVLASNCHETFLHGNVCVAQEKSLHRALQTTGGRRMTVHLLHKFPAKSRGEPSVGLLRCAARRSLSTLEVAAGKPQPGLDVYLALSFSFLQTALLGKGNGF